MRYTMVGEQYFRDEAPVTWQDIRSETGLGRGLSRLLLKKLVESGEDVDDIVAWRDKRVLKWKLEQMLS